MEINQNILVPTNQKSDEITGEGETEWEATPPDMYITERTFDFLCCIHWWDAWDGISTTYQKTSSNISNKIGLSSLTSPKLCHHWYKYDDFPGK